MDGEERRAYLNEKTPSYLCTKSTAGICSWTTSHPRTAVQEAIREVRHSFLAKGALTVRNPEAIEGEVQVRRVLIDVVRKVYADLMSIVTAMISECEVLTRYVHARITLASQVQILALELLEDIEELLEEPDDLRRHIILVLQCMKSERIQLQAAHGNVP